MAGVEQAAVGQAEDLLGDRAPEGVGVALLEVAAAATANQQGVAGEGGGLIVQDIGDAAVGVARGAAHREMTAAEAHLIAVLERQADVFGAGRFGEANGAAGGLLHEPAAGDVVGVGMGVQGGHEGDAQLTN